MNLNQGQQQAADAFFDFLLDPTRKELCISGPAGVGKTFWMGHIIDTVLPQYQSTCALLGIAPLYNSVQLTATTNKAAEVLGTATGRPAQTIHSFMNLRVADDFSTGRTLLKKTKKWKVHTNIILFVDEAYTADSQLISFIREGTAFSKIVWVGDHCQLDPVMETCSPLLAQNIPLFELTEQMRTTTPELQALNAQLRQSVETRVFRPIVAHPGIIDWVNSHEELEQVLQKLCLDPERSVKVLAYTNQRVNAFNDYIRRIRGITPKYVAGEHLICNTAYTPPGTFLGVEEQVTIEKLDDHSTFIPIEPDVDMEVRFATLATSYGDRLHNVPLPMDKEHHTALVRHYARLKDWPTYFSLKQNYPDLRPRDAATVHKAQGSTYETVVVDCEDLSTCRNPALAARLLYVATSRAKCRVIFYGELAAKYGGITHVDGAS